MQGGGQNGVAQGNQEVSSSEIPNNQSVAEGEGRTESGEVKTESALGETYAPGKRGVQEITNGEIAENGGKKQPRRKPRGFRSEVKKTTEELFAEEKEKAVNGVYSGDYAKVLAESNSIEEAISKFNDMADVALAQAEEWASRQYKKNNTVVTGQNPYSTADEYETTIGAANERRRDANIKRLNTEAETLRGYANTLAERTNYSPLTAENRTNPTKNAPEIQEPVFVEDIRPNGDKRITSYNSRGEVETVYIERDGKVVSVDSYDEGVLFEHTEYDDKGRASLVTRYDREGNVVGTQKYEDGKVKTPMQKLADQVLDRAEEKRRIPLRERARELEAQVGVKANIIESLDEVKNREARERIAAGEPVAGWYSGGQVYLYMPNIKDRREIELTYVHEVVAHHGVKKLLGERFNEFLDGVWNMMSEADRARMLAYVGVKENPTLQDMRAAADEYVAELAEKMNLGELEQSTWEKIVGWFKELLENIGFKNLTKEDIESMLKASYSRLRAQSTEYREQSKGAQFRIAEVNERFNERLLELDKDRTQKNRVLRLGKPSQFLKDADIVDADIEMEFDKFVKKSSENYENDHPFTAEEIMDLPKAIYAPIAVFDSTNGRDKVILTELKKDGKNFIVAIKTVERNRKGGVVLEVNEIATLYPKKAKGILSWINNGLLANVDKDKALDWLEALRTNRGTGLNNQELADAAKIVEGFENKKKKQENSSIRFRVANENQDIFVSNAQRAVEGIKQEKATPEQWLAMLQKNGGLKAGEDKWLGLSEWLNERGKEKGENGKVEPVTKQEVLDFIAENAIRIEEVEYSENARFKGQSYYADRYNAGEADDVMPANDTRLEYTTDGLENKREIALTVPTVEPYNQSDDVHFGDAGGGRAVAWVRFGETTVYETVEDVQEVTELHEPYRGVNGHDIYKPVGSFRSGDYIAHGKAKTGEMIYVVYINNKQIPVAHATLEEARNAMNEYYREHPRMLRKPVRVLVIDEIQSKRHQDGREKGYSGVGLAKEVLAAEEEVRKTNRELTAYREPLKEKYNFKELGGSMSERLKNFDAMLSEEERITMDALGQARNEAEKRLQELREQEKGIPSAPFEKNWHELAMKRMLRLAAEEGFDKVAWTTGEQQAERYNLSTQVGGIEVRRDNGEYNVFTYNTHGGLINTASGTMTPEQIAETFGKDLGGRIIAVESGQRETITGEDLRIGGEGMKGFYDRMLPSFVQKYTKKWGASVGTVEMPGLEENNVMHSVDVTPEMQESVMQGQTMFRIKDYSAEEQEIIGKAKADGSYMKAPNGKPTNLNERQWVQVRTANFKKWFGDWEKVARIEKLKKSDPVNIEFNNEYELNRDSAKQWMKDNLRGEYTNADTGENIAISKVGINEVTSHGSQDAVHLISLKAVPQFIENSVFIEEVPNAKDNDKYDSYRYYVCGARINGEDYTVKVVIGVKGDSKFYDHRLTQIEKGTLIDNLNGLSNSVAENQNTSLTGKDSKLISILQTNVSKVVDENGEPMVVYHGTKSGVFTVFDTDGKDKTRDTGAFFAERERDAMSYSQSGYYFNDEDFESADEWGSDNSSKGNYVVFLNIKNPYIQDFNDNSWDDIWGEKWKVYDNEGDVVAAFADETGAQEYVDNAENSDELQIEEDYDTETLDDFVRDVRKGYMSDVPNDGVYAKNIYDGGSEMTFANEWVAFSPNQIKSATDNTGEFSTENDDIRFRVVGGNSGYVGYSMSKRAAEARKEGRYPKSDFKKVYGVSGKSFDLLQEAGVIYNSEWHHTSKMGNRTDFFSWDNETDAEYYAANKKRIDKAVNEVEKLKPDYNEWKAIDKYLSEGRSQSEIRDLVDEDLRRIEPAEKAYKEARKALVEQMKDEFYDFYEQQNAKQMVRELIVPYAKELREEQERRNEKEERRDEGTRFRFIGEKGAANLDRAEEATTRLDNLAVAREMENAGKEAKVIKLATGWERGADGKWRYETPDELDFNLKAEGNKLVDYLNAPELYAAYPELKDAKFEWFTDASAYGEYDGQSNTLRLNSRYALERGKSTLAHEIQHAVQEIEGFARGSNVERFADVRGAVLDSLNFMTNGDLLKGSAISDVQSLRDALDKNIPYTEVSVKEGYAENLQKVARKYGYENIDALVEDFTNMPSAFEQYRRTAGEVESRNVQERMGMTEEERRNSLAAETEDVAREDQIFIYDNLGSASEGYIPSDEYEVLRQAVMRNNSLYGKNKPVETAFTADNFYIYNNYGDDNFSVIEVVPIVGNEDLIEFYNNSIQNGTYRNNEDFSKAAASFRGQQEQRNSSKRNAQGQRGEDAGTVSVDLRQSSERGGDNAQGNSDETGIESETRFRTVEETTEGSIDDVPAQPLTLMERITNSLLEVSANVIFY